MKIRSQLILLILLLLGHVSQIASANKYDIRTENDNDKFRVHGLSSFKTGDKDKISQWLTNGVNATRATLGVYPRPLELYVYPKESNQPVPWAHTRRDNLESIHFYIDSRFPLEKFVDDWTIYHEISHLALPYLGSEYSWFSEGFASFMQYQIMAEMGLLEGTLKLSYEKKVSPHLRWFNSDLAASKIAQRLMSKRNYPAAYWGGAWFFVLADQQLRKKHNVTLNMVVEQYQNCCRLRDESVQEVVASFDQLIDDPLFTTLLHRFENQAARELYPEEFTTE
ncbi:MAG: hypothetical protein ACI88A_001202 [Paraglaciecola sp.]|jgi:hypothetical protein